jgi:hypothetical protein
MEKINYPLDITEEEYEDINNDIVKIKTLRENFCILNAFLNAVSEEYQNSPEVSKKLEIVNTFRYQLKEFLKLSSSHTNSYFVKKITAAYEISEFKDRYKLKLKRFGGDIFDLIMIKKEEDSMIHYSLFSKKTTDMLSSNSNFFDVVSLNFIKDMLDQRFLLKYRQEKLKYLTSEDIVEKKDLEEIIRRMQDKNLLLDPSNLMNLLDYSECIVSDILLRFLGEIFDINFFVCRGWKTGIVTVLEEIFISSKYPHIIFFKTEGPVSITGIEKEIFYETGGIKDLNGIITILNNNKSFKMVEELRENFKKNIDNVVMEKYKNYLKSMISSFNLPIIYEEEPDEKEDMTEEKEDMTEEKEDMMEEKEDMMEEKEDMMEEDPESYISFSKETSEFDPDIFVTELKNMNM